MPLWAIAMGKTTTNKTILKSAIVQWAKAHRSNVQHHIGKVYTGKVHNENVFWHLWIGSSIRAELFVFLFDLVFAIDCNCFALILMF